MGKSYKEAVRILSRQIEAKGASVFDHPTAKGDDREGLIETLFRPRIGATFEAVKGEIVDSLGRSTGEMDLIIYDRSVGSCIAEGSRHLVRVESVVATVEIKSRVDLDDLRASFKGGNKGLLQLQRFYYPTELFEVMGSFLRQKFEADKEGMLKGFSAMGSFSFIPAIPNFVIGFGGLPEESTEEFLQLPGVEVVSILGKYTVGKDQLGHASNPPKLYRFGEGDDALGAFVYLMEQAQQHYLQAARMAAPNWRRYFWSPEAIRAKPGGEGESSTPGERRDG